MSQFRIVMWPRDPVPLPKVLVLTPVTVEDREGLHGGPYLCAGYRVKWQTLPEELYLRGLHSLDVTDPDAVAAFCSQYGMLGIETHGSIPPGDYGDFCTEEDARYAHSLERHFTDEGDLEGYEAVVPLWKADSYVAVIRDLTRIWRYHQGELTFNQVQEAWESIIPGGGRLDYASEPQIPGEMYEFLNDFLGAALSEFHVHPTVYEGKQRLSEPGRLTSLYPALCLQLANHIAEKARYRTCQRCGKLFVRQQGRAKFDQHRVNDPHVLYCSKECARMAAQKAYRDRKAASRRQAKGAQP